MKSWRALVSLAFILAAVIFLFERPHAAVTRAAVSAEPSLQKQRTSQEQRTPTIEEYQPKSTLVTKEHKIERAKFPFIDIHSHHWNPTPEHVEDLIKGMDSINLRVLVNLSGGSGEELRKTVVTMKGRYPDRFVVFANMRYDDLNTPGFGKRAAARLEQDVKNGAQGLKIFKDFGMELKYASGQRVHVDDPEFDPVFEKCAELKIPVLIHVAEPSAFFDPWDYSNERWLELKQFPGRARPAADYPPFETLMTERNHLFAKHARTNFIAAHLAFYGNDLERLGNLFDAYPNVNVDIAAVLAELGRQPYSAHDFLIKYQDRILMGKDIYEVNEYKWYFRCLETRDEYFEYYRKRHAFWRIYGFEVPDEVLKKVYYKNALKLVPGLDANAFPK
ncbi:MAG TPA: amidohydrolase family protein [Candidatus Acidoferrum sp.]|nr:amidohydrolase family protein [Candidatus Acidoferrum sp.]